MNKCPICNTPKQEIKYLSIDSITGMPFCNHHLVLCDREYHNVKDNPFTFGESNDLSIWLRAIADIRDSYQYDRDKVTHSKASDKAKAIQDSLYSDSTKSLIDTLLITHKL